MGIHHLNIYKEMFKRFLYFFAEEDGRTLRIDDNGIVSSTNTRVPLDPTPSGWDDVSIAYERDPETLGNGRIFTLPLNFFRGPARILRNESYKKSMERKIFLIITMLYLEIDQINATYKRFYKAIYKGLVDWNTFNDLESSVKVSMTQGGTEQKVKAYKNTTYEFLMDDPEANDLKMDGMDLFQTSNFVIPNVQSSQNGGPLPVIFTSNDGAAPNLIVVSQDPASPGQYFIKNVSDVPVIIHEFNGSVKFTVNARVQEVFIHLDKFIGNVFTDIQLDHFKPVDVNSTYEVNYNLGNDTNNAITINAGESITLFSRVIPMVGDVLDPAFIIYEETAITISFKSKYKATNVKVFKPSVVFKKLVESMTSDAAKAVSELILANDNLVLTCGNAIRGLPGAKFKTTFTDFYKFCKVIMAAGQGVINENVVIEAYKFFLNTDDPIDLGEIKLCTITYATDLLGNSFKTGYNEQSYNNVNGKYEFNNTHSYSSSNTVTPKEISFICPYRADPYGAEFLRANLDGKTTTDNDSDNDIFIFNTEKTNLRANASFGNFFNIGFMAVYGQPSVLESFIPGSTFTLTNAGVNNGTYEIDKAFLQSNGVDIIVFIKGQFTQATIQMIDISTSQMILKRVAYDFIDGIPNPETVYNIEQLTPTTILLTQSEWINSVMYGYEGQKVTFQTTQKNADLIRTKGGITIEEKGNYTVAKKRLFIPRYFNIQDDFSAQQLELLNKNPNRCFRFVWRNQVWEGFSWRVGSSIDTNSEQAIKLLATPNNDFTKMII
jgi:hypothetical protein